MTVGKLVIDVGSGGGLPGLVVALAREDLQVTLLEAVQKKVRFLEYAKQSLQVENATVVLGRAETFARDEAQRESYDVALTRAVASLPVVLEYCSPFVRVGGHVVAMKGAISEDELEKGLSAGERLGVEIEEVVRVQPFLGETESGRRLLVFTKSRATPERYPRRVGLAKKRPLGEARP
jgi:16S rRNA (guanine527-N7)-methyltransferase